MPKPSRPTVVPLVVGLVAGLFLILRGAANQPAPFVGQASFSIHWDNAYALTPSDEDKATVDAWKEDLVRDLVSPWSSQRQGAVLKLASDSAPDDGSILGDARPRLRITTTEPEPLITLVTITAGATDASIAQAFTVAALKTAQDTVRTRFRIRGASGSLGSIGTADDLNAEIQDAVRERVMLEREAYPSAEQRARITQLRRIESRLEQDKAINGIGLIMNFGQTLFGPELPIIQPPQVTPRSLLGHWMIVLAVALVAALLVAGCATIGLKVVTRLIKSKDTTGTTSPPPLPSR